MVVALSVLSRSSPSVRNFGLTDQAERSSYLIVADLMVGQRDWYWSDRRSWRAESERAGSGNSGQDCGCRRPSRPPVLVGDWFGVTSVGR